jgi:hypothetical protein
MNYRLLCCFIFLVDRGTSFSIVPTTTTSSFTTAAYATTTTRLRMSKSNNKPNNPNTKTTAVEEYRNVATKILSNFLSKADDDGSSSLSSVSSTRADTNANDNASTNHNDPDSGIDWDAPKVPCLDISVLAQALDAELYEKEWFVTGNVNPIYFSNEFRFQDPDVQLSGIRSYAEGVRKLFDQNVSRAEIIETKVTSNDTITCTWRLSGKVQVGPGWTIKPYIVYTDFTVREGLIVFQQDRFEIPQWDILLSAFFPFLIGTLTSPPAPVPPMRDPPPTMPPQLVSSRKTTSSFSPFGSIMQLFTKK